MSDGAQSALAFHAAQRVLPGGVNSPVRAFQAVGGEPHFITRGEGAYVVDADGRRLIDYVCAFGPLILGHAHPDVVQALQDTAARGAAFGAPTELETALAERVVAALPSAEQVRFVNSGTEATMTAIRLARGITNRNKVLKFDGCYHGHADGLLARAGSGIATLSLPDSAGVPPAYAAETLIAPYNDLDAVTALAHEHAVDLAAIIVEPVAANMGVVPPRDGFLAGLRDVAASAGALLIFDEVITGFRVHPGGAQTLYGVHPDLTCLGKVVGGGLPVGAVAGSRAFMEQLAPLGPVYQAGTLSGNPLTMAAGVATLDALAAEGAYDALEQRAAQLAQGLEEAARAAGVPYGVNRVGSLLTGFFTDVAPHDYPSAARSDTQAFTHFFQAMLAEGVQLAPSKFEAMFISLAHGPAEIDATLQAAKAAMRAVVRRQ